MPKINQRPLKISLCSRVHAILQDKAARLGIPVNLFIKNLIIKDLGKRAYPIFKASARTEKLAKKAIKERELTITVDNLDDFFNKL
jgi:hypothetical protein